LKFIGMGRLRVDLRWRSVQSSRQVSPRRRRRATYRLHHD